MPGLWPNRTKGRHWRTVAQMRKAAKIEAGWLMVEQGVQPREWPEGRVPVRLTMHPPTRRRFDDDNLIAACKGQFDAVAERIGLDDSRWALEPVRGEVRPGGAVVLEFP
jgi:hypothetical protein